MKLGDPLFELESQGSAFERECRIPARKADPQDNLHHPLSGGIGSGSKTTFLIEKRIQDNLHHGPLSSSKSGSPRQPSTRPPFKRDWLGIRFSSWNAGFQLEKRIQPRAGMPDSRSKSGSPRQPSSRPLFRGMPDSSWKSGSSRQPSSRPLFRRDWLGIRFSSWNAGFQLEKRIPKTTFIAARFQKDWPG